MKNKFSYLFLIVFAFFCCLLNPEAAIKVKVNYNNTNLRTGPGTNYDKIKTLAINSTYNLVDNKLEPNQKGCSNGWYKIYYSQSNIGYICSDYVDLLGEDVPVNSTAESDCEKTLESAGFPSSYWPNLCALKEIHPNWNFEADKNGLDFQTSVDKESADGKTLIQTSNEGYLNTNDQSYDYLTDQFLPKEGKTWYNADPRVIAYYLDPRNFFDEKYIFMFEKLSFDEKYQTIEAIEAVLNNRDIVEKASVIFEASQSFNINSIYIASKIRQETGGNYSNYSLTGKPITVDDKKYDHIYNPYNIGANTGAYDGLVWAASGKSYLRPWVDLDVAIKGGAQFISSTYIAKGQDSIYFQKFNTSSYSGYNPYAHEYMANVQGAASEASIAYSGYKKMDLLDKTAFTFIIPVYENMNASNYELPNKGNPNNHLSKILINGSEIKNFAHDNFEYTYYVSTAVNKINIEAEVINTKTTVKGIGEVTLDKMENVLNIVVTAENGDEQTYQITVIKTEGIDIAIDDLISELNIPITDNYMSLSAGYTIENLLAKVNKIAATAKVTVTDKEKGLIATSDVIVITNGSESKTFNAVIKGDTNGDGNINVQDLLRIQKYILGYVDLTGSQMKAADTNQDLVVNAVDLLRVQKHILGYLVIE